MSIEPMGWLSRVWRGDGTRVVLPENGGRAHGYRMTPALMKVGKATSEQRRAMWLSQQHACVDVTAEDLEQEKVDARMLRVVRRLEGKADRLERLEEAESLNSHLRARCRELEEENQSLCNRANSLAGECQVLQSKLDAMVALVVRRTKERDEAIEDGLAMADDIDLRDTYERVDRSYGMDTQAAAKYAEIRWRRGECFGVNTEAMRFKLERLRT